MALNKQELENKIIALLSLAVPPNAVDPKDCATKISEYVDEYLANLELDAFPVAGLNPTGVTDPLVATNGAMAEKTQPSAPLKAPNFKAKLIALMAPEEPETSSGDFTECGPEYAADMALMVGVIDGGGYIAAGASACETPPSLNVAFDKGKGLEDHVAVAKEIANQIHSATTSTTFTAAGPYSNPAGFVQLSGIVPPGSEYSSTFK